MKRSEAFSKRRDVKAARFVEQAECNLLRAEILMAVAASKVPAGRRVVTR
jgi:hypothetical protein